MKRSPYYTYLQTFQSARLKRDYAHLASQRQYEKLSDFFFNEMYGPQDFHARDAQAKRLHNFLHLAPGLTMRDIDVCLELLELTNRLDWEVVMVLEAMHAPIPFDEELYDEAFLKADSYQPRLKQIALLRESLIRVSRFATMPMLGTALANMKTLARLTGMRDLHAFLLKGYSALREVRDLHPFLDEVSGQELVRLNRIYGVTE